MLRPASRAQGEENLIIYANQTPCLQFNILFYKNKSRAFTCSVILCYNRYTNQQIKSQISINYAIRSTIKKNTGKNRRHAGG